MSDNEFRLEKQKLLVEYVLSDESIFQRCKTILNPDYFDKELRETVGYILKYSNEYSFVPSMKQIKVETDLELELNTSMKQKKHSSVPYLSPRKTLTYSCIWQSFKPSRATKSVQLNWLRHWTRNGTTCRSKTKLRSTI